MPVQTTGETIEARSESRNALVRGRPLAALQTKLLLYRELSKSGIVFLVLLTTTAGYLVTLPQTATFSLSVFLMTLFGVLLLASGSSALNQIQEWKIDCKMKRTASRPIPSGRLSLTESTLFSVFGIVAGCALLYKVNLQVFALGLLAVFSYNGLYTLWWKRHWAYAAVPGALPGALPILIGATAATGYWATPSGLYLFAVLFIWQMPHFWVLALKYQQDYRDGGFPTLPVALGKDITVSQIQIWALAYVGSFFLAPLYLPLGLIYLATSIALALKIQQEKRKFIHAPESKNWLSFFLWINFSLIFLLAAACLDLWKLTLFAPLFVLH